MVGSLDIRRAFGHRLSHPRNSVQKLTSTENSQFQTSAIDETKLMNGEQSLDMIDSKIRIRGTDENSDRNPWGILGDMPKRFPNFLDRHPLSHFSHGTPVQRFIKQNRLGLASVILLSIIFLG